MGKSKGLTVGQEGKGQRSVSCGPLLKAVTTLKSQRSRWQRMGPVLQAWRWRQLRTGRKLITRLIARLRLKPELTLFWWLSSRFFGECRLRREMPLLHF